MPCSEIVRIAVTVGVTQLICDLVANQLVFKQEAYKKSLATLERARVKWTKTEVSSSDDGTKTAKQQEKQAKRLQRARDDFDEAAANVASHHTRPSVLTSFVFLILLRVMGHEHRGAILGILPLIPFGGARRLITQRGLEFVEDFAVGETTSAVVTSHHQACGFLCIYILSSLSVKYFVHRLVGTHPPAGADEGLMTVMQSPKGKRMLKAWGVDEDVLS